MTKNKKIESQTPTQNITKSIIKKTTRDNGSTRVQILFEGQGRTHQEFRDEANINTIVNRWKKTGQLPPVKVGQPLFADFSGPMDYQDQLERVMLANEAFDALPSAVRALVDNDPRFFLEMMETEEGRADLAEAGLRIAASDPTENGSPEPPREPSDGPSAGTPNQPPAAEKGSQNQGE